MPDPVASAPGAGRSALGARDGDENRSLPGPRSMEIVIAKPGPDGGWAYRRSVRDHVSAAPAAHESTRSC